MTASGKWRANAFLLGLLAAPLVAGQEARQGVAPTPAPTTTMPPAQSVFTSPMILETVLPINDPSKWMDPESLDIRKKQKPDPHFGHRVSIPEWYALGKYTVDGVALREKIDSGLFWSDKRGIWEEPGLQMEVEKEGFGRTVKLRAIVYNPPHNHDKRVEVRFDILAGDRIVYTQTGSRNVADNGHDGKDIKIEFDVTAEQLPTITGLRLTISTQNY